MKLAACAALALAVLISGRADAATVRVDFAGVLTEVTPGLAPQMSLDQPVQGFVVFRDDGLIDLYGNSQLATYPFPPPDAIVAGSVSIGSYAVTEINPSFAAQITVYDGYENSDAFYVTSGVTGPEVNGFAPIDFTVSIHGPTSVLSSDAVPSAEDLARFSPGESLGAAVFFSPTSGLQHVLWRGTEFSASAAPVPEPPLLTFGLTCLLAVTRARASRSTAADRRRASGSGCPG